MAIIDGLLKLDGSDGSLKKMTAAEENYIAHQAGLQLADAGVGEVGSITTTSSGNATVGTYTNTTMDGSVGGHDATARNVSTNTVTIYQKEGTAATSGGTYFQPVIYDNSATKTLKVVNTTEMNVVVDRLLLSIFANDYAGTYQLASSAPSGDYSAHISNVFSDTRADGTTVNYSIWKRDTFTEPTKISPMRLLNSSGDLQAMSVAQIKYTFGQVAKNRIMNGSGGVGTYLLRSSSQGVPSATGTWAAKGTATDIRNTLADQNYTRDSTTNFAGNYSGAAYEAAYQSDYVGVYAGDYIGEYAGNYIGEYAGNYETHFAGDYEGNYDGSGTYTGNSVGTYDQTYVGDYSGPTLGGVPIGFVGDYLVDYEGNYGTGYEGNFDGQYTRDSTTAYESVYAGTDYTHDFQRTRGSVLYYSSYAGGFSSFVGNFIGNYQASDYTSNYVANYVGNYDGLYVGGSESMFAGDYEGKFMGNYAPDYTGTYLGTYSGDYEGNFAGGAVYTGLVYSQYTANFVGDYAGNYVGDYGGNYIGDYTGNFTSNYVANYVADYIGDYTGNFVGNYAGSTIQSGVQTIETYTLYVRTA